MDALCVRYLSCLDLRQREEKSGVESNEAGCSCDTCAMSDAAENAATVEERGECADLKEKKGNVVEEMV